MHFYYCTLALTIIISGIIPENNAAGSADGGVPGDVLED